MDRLQPPDDAYGRVTDPERFRPLHAVADRIVEELTAAHDVEIVPGDPGSFGSTGQIDVVRVAQLVPAVPKAAPLTIAYTDFPGLMVRVGQWHVETFRAAVAMPATSRLTRLSATCGGWLQQPVQAEAVTGRDTPPATLRAPLLGPVAQP